MQMQVCPRHVIFKTSDNNKNSSGAHFRPTVPMSRCHADGDLNIVIAFVLVNNPHFTLSAWRQQCRLSNCQASSADATAVSCLATGIDRSVIQNLLGRPSAVLNSVRACGNGNMTAWIPAFDEMIVTRPGRQYARVMFWVGVTRLYQGRRNRFERG